MRIAERFLEDFSKRDGKAFQGFTPAAADVFQRYPWPGNVRQLQNAVQQIVVLHDGEQVEAEMLPEAISTGDLESVQMEAVVAPAAPVATAPTALEPQPEPVSSISSHVSRREQIQPLWLTEKHAIETAIETCDGNVNQAAGLLEVAPSTIYRKLQSWKKLQA